MLRHLLILVGICLLTFFVGLGRPAITDSDEAFYAESAREMVETGDWLTPHFNYRVRFEKPILYYWGAALGYLVAGVGETAARLPSALAGLGLVLLAFFCARRWCEPQIALLAGVITATSFGYVAMARQSLPDLPLACFISLAIWAAMRAWLDDPSPDTLRSPAVVSTTDSGRRGWVAVAGLAAAAALLTKGPVGLVLPALVVGPLVLFEVASGRSTWRMTPRHLAFGAIVFLVAGAPWFVGMTLEHGTAYLHRFFIGENVDRFATARYNDPRPVWYYVPIVAGGLLPWSPFMLLWLPALARTVRRVRTPSTLEIRLLWWALAPLLFFTASVGKQPRYVLPILPPLAILLARTIRHHLGEPVSGRGLSVSGIVAGALLVVVAGLVYRAQPLLTEWTALATGMASLALLVSGVIVGLASVLARRWVPAALTIASIVAGLATHYIILASPGDAPVQRMAALVRDAQQPGVPYGRHRVFDRNLIFYTQQPFVELTSLQSAQDFLQSRRHVLCVLRAEDAQALRRQGVELQRLGEVRYLNTGNLNMRTLLNPDPAVYLQHVVLVSNR